VKTVEIHVSGRVQSVGFRACTRKIATNLGITGEVMNLPDGRVRICASADAAVLEKFVSLLYECPRVVIRSLAIADREHYPYPDFSIRRMLE
jgi:acylphosphatase